MEMRPSLCRGREIQALRNEVIVPRDAGRKQGAGRLCWYVICRAPLPPSCAVGVTCLVLVQQVFGKRFLLGSRAGTGLWGCLCSSPESCVHSRQARGSLMLSLSCRWEFGAESSHRWVKAKCCRMASKGARRKSGGKLKV